MRRHTLCALLLLPALAVSLPDWTPVEYTAPAGVVPILGTGSLEPLVVDAPASVSVTPNAVRATGRAFTVRSGKRWTNTNDQPNRSASVV